MRSQSAMEYLMTYGWAILIIAVVLGVLFQLGVFSGGALAPRAQPGACQVERFAGQISLEGQCNGLLPQYVAQFSGVTGQYINIPYSSSLSTNTFTLSFWYETDVVSTISYQYAFYSTTWGMIGKFDSTGNLWLGYPDRWMGITPNPLSGAWYNAVSVDNGIDCWAYLNGVSTQAPVTCTPAYYTSGSLQLGGPSGISSLDGSISNVQLYNTIGRIHF